VLFVSTIVLLSLFLAPNRGIVWNWLKQQSNRRQLRLETVLSHLYRLAAQHEDLTYGHSMATLRVVDFGRGGVERSLEALTNRGWVRRQNDDTWALTSTGVMKAQQLLPQQPLSHTDINNKEEI